MNLSSDRDFAAFIERVDGLNLDYERWHPPWAHVRARAYDAETAALREKRAKYQSQRTYKRRVRQKPRHEPVPTFTQQQIDIALRAMERRETA